MFTTECIAITHVYWCSSFFLGGFVLFISFTPLCCAQYINGGAIFQEHSSSLTAEVACGININVTHRKLCRRHERDGTCVLVRTQQAPSSLVQGKSEPGSKGVAFLLLLDAPPHSVSLESQT